MNNTVTEKQIEDLLEEAYFETMTVYGKTTIVSCQLENGFVITESSSCVDPKKYDENKGFMICYERIKNKLWELEGYVLQKKIYEEEK